jgi:hypothetical protein
MVINEALINSLRIFFIIHGLFCVCDVLAFVFHKAPKKRYYTERASYCIIAAASVALASWLSEISF